MRAGYRNPGNLARELGVPKGTVYQWERHSGGLRLSHRPSGESILRLKRAFDVPVKELVARLWGEKLGEPAPCGCGKLGFPYDHTDPKVHERILKGHKLLINLPCAKCENESGGLRES